MDLVRLSDFRLHEDFENTIKEVRDYLSLNNSKASKVFRLAGAYKDFSEGFIKVQTAHLKDYLSYVKDSFEISQEKGIWRACSGLGIVPHEDYFTTTIKYPAQFFNTSGQLLFQTVDLFEHLEYAYDDLLACPWQNLFERDQSITDYLMKCAMQVFETKQPMKIETGFHKVTQVHAHKRAVNMINVKVAYPLFGRGTKDLVGYVVTYEVKECEDDPSLVKRIGNS